LLHAGGLVMAAVTMRAQSLPVRGVKPDYKEDFFYREDWLGEPWRKPEPVVLIHGNDESSVEWYAWVPRMAQEYRLIRPDLPGLGHSNVPRGFECPEGDDRILEHALQRAGSRGRKGPQQIALEFRSRQGGRLAAHHRPHTGDHRGPQQNAFGRKGACLPGANSEFETRGHSQR